MEKEVETFKNDVMSLAEHNGIIHEVQVGTLDCSLLNQLSI